MLLFGKTTKFIEETNNDNLYVDFYSYTETVDNFTLLLIKATTEEYNKLISKIENTFNEIEISEKDFERCKKVIISNFIKDTTKIDIVNDLVVNSIINNNKVYTDYISIIKKLKYETLLKILKKIDFNNKSIVIMEKNI
jgi:predicted Zn-dependent peptidase